MQEKKKVLNLLGLSERAGKLTSGTEAVNDLLKSGRASLVVIASDLGDNTKERIASTAETVTVPVVQNFSAAELSHAIGRQRKVLALSDAGFAKAILSKINRGV